MNLDKLNPDVLGAVRQYLGGEDEDDDSRDAQIAAMKPVEVFDRYLKWNGIIGYGATIWEAVENIKEAAGGKEGDRT